MFLNYISRGKKFHRAAFRKFSVFTAVLIACALLGHTFDSCSAHLGAFASEQISITQIDEQCTNGNAENCEICTSRDEHHDDVCGSLSEYAVRNSSGNQSASDAGIIIHSAAILLVTPRQILLSSSLAPRAGPAFAAPISVTLRTALPSRAPPFCL